MTNHPNPFQAEADKQRRYLRVNPAGFARDLADQHFHEAIDNLQEQARDNLVVATFEDLRVSLKPAEFQLLVDCYQERITQWSNTLPADLPEEVG